MFSDLLMQQESMNHLDFSPGLSWLYQAFLNKVELHILLHQEIFVSVFSPSPAPI